MSQSCARQNADKAVDEERIEVLVFYFLFFIKVFHEEVGKHYSDDPAQGIPPNTEPSDLECIQVGGPKDKG